MEEKPEKPRGSELLTTLFCITIFLVLVAIALIVRRIIVGWPATH